MFQGQLFSWLIMLILLGIPLDIPLSFHKHVSLVSPSCYFHIKAPRHIRPCLDTQTAATIAHYLANSRLDYANSILYSAPDFFILKFQWIQNTLARIILQSDTHTSAGLLLKQLHWLPVHSRIHFKLATILNIQGSPYFWTCLPFFTAPVSSTRLFQAPFSWWLARSWTFDQ